MVLGTRLSMCRSIMSLSKITHQVWEVVLLGAGMGAGVETLNQKGRVGNKNGRAGSTSLPTKTI